MSKIVALGQENVSRQASLKTEHLSQDLNREKDPTRKDPGKEQAEQRPPPSGVSLPIN